MTFPRIITAFILVPLILVSVWFGTLPFFFLVLGISLLGVWEYCLMAEEGGYPNQLFLSLLGVVAILLALFIDGLPRGPIKMAPNTILVLVLWVFIVFFREVIRKDDDYSMLRSITTISGVLLIAFFMGHLLLIRELRYVEGDGFKLAGRELVYFLIFVVWAVDTGGWFFGKKFGRIPLAPRISPKKTWEGAVGGTVVGCLVGWLSREVFFKFGMSLSEALLFSFVIAVTSQASDLIESLMKRSFGMKDSSQLLPGHGGILDRFDGYIFAAPFFYYLLLSTGRFF
jgi:phosphatidate cytidylyltransferase